MKKIVNLSILTIYFILGVSIVIKLKDALTLKEVTLIILFLGMLEYIFLRLLKNKPLLPFVYPCLLIVIVFLFSLNVKSDNVISFVQDVFANEFLVDNYRLISLKSKNYDLEELKNQKIGYTKDTAGVDDIGVPFKAVCYDNNEDLILALNKEEIAGALVLYDQYLLMDDTKYEIIQKITFKEDVTPVVKNIEKNTFLVYISTGNNENSKSEVNLVLGFNRQTKEILLITIPGDYYVYLPSKGEADKLAYASIYGASEAISAVENLLDNQIDYYLKIDFIGLKKLIDNMGGIEIENEKYFIASGVEFRKGLIEINGEEALIYTSFNETHLNNHELSVNQEKVLEGTIKKLFLDSKYLDYLEELKQTIKTNIPKDRILKLIKEEFAYNDKYNITKLLLNGSDSYETTYSYKCCKLNVIIPDQTLINEAKTLIEYLKADGKFN